MTPPLHWLPVPEHTRGAREWRIRAWYEYCPETGQVRHRRHPTGAALRERRGEIPSKPRPGGSVLLVADVPGEIVRVLAPVSSLGLLALAAAGWVRPPPGLAHRVALRPGADRATLDALGWRYPSREREWIPLELTDLGAREWRGPAADASLPPQVRSLLSRAGRRAPDEVDQDQPHSVLTAHQARRWMPPGALPTRALRELRPAIYEHGIELDPVPPTPDDD